MKIDAQYIRNLIKDSTNNTSDEQISQILQKAGRQKGLTHQEVAALLTINKQEHLQELFELASQFKQDIYGKRVVIFAPIYVSDHCVNTCTYCGYKVENKFPRKKLTQAEVAEQVKVLIRLGHKRVALEAGEDPVNCTLDYVLECLDTIYDTKFENGNIRRVNVNIAAASVEEYSRLKDAGIGTYILFQETYDPEAYKKAHPKGIKANYDWHLNAMDRAMEAGIDDVGGGILFGLGDHKFDVLALMMHNEHLENTYNAGFHTISVPRLKQADGMSLEEFPDIISDDEFKKIVAILRIAVPFAGMILSTRETVDIRAEVIKYGISQISSGSCTGVGAYQDEFTGNNVSKQFEVADNRTPLETNKWLVCDDQLPSYCTACYRNGRTGEDFMHLAHTGQIQVFCQPNSLLTLLEYSLDYGDAEMRKMTDKKIEKELKLMKEGKIKELTIKSLQETRDGKRDIYI